MAFFNKVPLYQLPVFRVLVVQAIIIVIMALGFLLGKGLVASYSAFFGGLIALLPNIYFTLKAFRYFGAQSAVAVTLALWTGEMGKYVLTAVLFVLVFVGVKQLDLKALFISYFIVLLASSFGLLLVKKRFKH